MNAPIFVLSIMINVVLLVPHAVAVSSAIQVKGIVLLMNAKGLERVLMITNAVMAMVA